MEKFNVILSFEFDTETPMEAAKLANDAVNSHHNAEWTWGVKNILTNKEYKVDLEARTTSTIKKTETHKNFNFESMSNTELQNEINEVSRMKSITHNKHNLVLSRYNHLLSKRRVNPLKFAEADREVEYFNSIDKFIYYYHSILLDEQNQRIDNDLRKHS